MPEAAIIAITLISLAIVIGMSGRTAEAAAQ